MPDMPKPLKGRTNALPEMREHDLGVRRIGVPLYGNNPNTRLIDFLNGAGSKPDPVAPYLYAPATDDSRVIDLIAEMAAGRIDAIAFTSAPQVRRLVRVAEESRAMDTLRRGLARTMVAAVGPVVAEQLGAVGAHVDIEPEGAYFMKPLVNAIVAALSRDGGAAVDGK